MVRKQTLAKRSQYEKVYKSGIAKSDKYIVIKALANNLEFSRFGYSTNKSLGNAVNRNRVRRRLKEIIRAKYIKPGWDIVVIARSSTVGIDYHRLEKSVDDLLKRADLLLNKNEVASTEVN